MNKAYYRLNPQAARPARPRGKGCPMKLTVITRDNQRREVQLQGLRLTVGRAQDNDLVLNDTELSRRHAEFLQDAGQWWIRDCGSKNGTFFNGRRLGTEERAPLGGGDTITLGQQVKLVFGSFPEVVVPSPVPDGLPSTGRTLFSLPVSQAAATGLTRILVDAAREIVGHRPAAETLRALLTLALRATSAERGMIAALKADRILEPLATASPAGVPSPVVSRSVVDRILQEESALILEDVNIDEQLARAGTIVRSGVRSILCAPLGISRPFRGLIYLDSLHGEVAFQPSHLEVVAILAGMANLVLENESARAAEEARRVMQAQLQAAAEIQSALLPSPRPRTPEKYTAAAHHQSCLTVGGDLFHFFRVPEGYGMMLADIAGKGLAAALLMATLQARWDGLLCSGLGHDRWLVKLNDDLGAYLPANRFVTLCFGIVDAEQGRLRFGSAGHCEALLIRESGTEVLKPSGPPLGLMPGMDYPIVDLPFDPGTRLLFCSDGVLDQENPAGEPFGFGRLMDLARSHRREMAPQMVEGVRAGLEAFAGEAVQNDDTTLTVMGTIPSP